MAKNGITTQYDDAGYPAVAAFTTPLTYTAAPVAVKNSPGRLLKVIVTTAIAGTSESITIYDSNSAGSGTILLVVPGGAAAGTVYDVNLPAASGIYVTETGCSAGAITVGWS